MSTNQNQTLVNRFFDEVCNQRNLSIANELFASDHVYHDPQSPTGPGPEGMNQVIAAYHSAFPDAHWHVIETINAGNNIITRWKGTGTQKNELLGMQPTGKSVTVEGIWIHRIENNKIAESWNVWDTLGMLQQLGIVPMMKQPAGEMAG